VTEPLLHARPPTAAEEIGAVGALGLPADVLAESVRRLQVVALLYAAAFFLAGLFPNLLCQVIAALNPNAACLPGALTDVRFVGPPTVSILMGLAVFTVARWSPLSPATKLDLGLVFEVLGSIGIAVAEYQGIASGIQYQGAPTGPEYYESFGLSWVAVWVLTFTTVVPSRPHRALAAAVCSLSTVPLVFALLMRFGITTIEVGALPFFFGLVLPYLIVAGMAGVSATVVYRLGAEIREARELGSYRLVERLGAGGMGEVWRAEHRLLARPAAVKLIRPESLGAGGPERRRVILRRFEREAQATASMRCPHTVELYDFGVADDGTFFCVMELLDGLDLDLLVRKHGPLPAARAVHLLRQVCHSLGEAHEIGLIHRDVKPANIFACRYGRETDWVKVLDFGMVKHREERGDSDPKLTADNVVGGTPAYMAPEQALGEPVDGRADLYALGCVAYWLLTGQQAAKGRTPLETMMQHVHATVEPPSRRTELPVPTALDEAVMRCLRKDPTERFQAADDLACALEAVPLDSPWSAAQAAQWWNTHYPRAPRRP
jgi:eukaryotic-like serine/threonine-protein kinase